MKSVITAVLMVGLAFAQPASAQEAPPSSNPEIYAATAVGGVLGGLPGALAGVVIMDHPIGLVIGGTAGVALGSFMFLNRERVDNRVAMTAVIGGLLAAGATSLLIDSVSEVDGGVLVVIPISYVAVTGAIANLWR